MPIKFYLEAITDIWRSAIKATRIWGESIVYIRLYWRAVWGPHAGGVAPAGALSGAPDGVPHLFPLVSSLFWQLLILNRYRTPTLRTRVERALYTFELLRLVRNTAITRFLHLWNLIIAYVTVQVYVSWTFHIVFSYTNQYEQLYFIQWKTFRSEL